MQKVTFEYDHDAWLEKHYYPRDIHRQLYQWGQDHASDLAKYGIKVESVKISETPVGDGSASVQLGTSSLLASVEAWERGFMDLQIIDIELGTLVLNSHLEWQTSIEEALMPFVKMLKDSR